MNEHPYSKEVSELLQKIKETLTNVNLEQEQKRQGMSCPTYIVHGTHVDEKTFIDIYNQKHPESKLASDEMMLPAFSKETQNELNAIRDLQQGFINSYTKKHPELTDKQPYEILQAAGYPLGADLQKELEIPERVFGIPSKTDNANLPMLDEKGLPIPQDGSYAYALKKCSYRINFSEDGYPILIGSEKRFADFGNGNKKGHIFILDGRNFKPEINEQGNITEYTAVGDAKILNHQEVTPKEVMKHNGQLVMFKTDEDYEKWSSQGHFDFVLNNDSIMMKSLAEEIKAGRATYINATNRGEKPLISLLEQAQIKKTISDHLTICRNKLNKEKTEEFSANKVQNTTANKPYSAQFKKARELEK